MTPWKIKALQARADGLRMMSILVTFSRCCVVTVWYQPLAYWGIWTLKLNFYGELFIFCSSFGGDKNALFLWDSGSNLGLWMWKCLAEFGFCKVFQGFQIFSYFVSSLNFLKWKPNFFFLNSSSYFWWMGLFWVFCYFCEGLDSEVPNWSSEALVNCLSASLEAVWWKAVPCRSVLPGFSCCLCCFVWMSLQAEGMWPDLCKDPRTDLYSLANNFPVFCAVRRNFFYSLCGLIDPSSWVEKVHKFLQEQSTQKL